MFEPQNLKLQALSAMANNQSLIEVNTQDILDLFELVNSQAVQLHKCREKNILFTMRALQDTNRIKDLQAELLSFRFPNKSKRRWFFRK